MADDAPDVDVDVDEDIDDADRRNGEPAATEHPTGEKRARENRETDPPV